MYKKRILTTLAVMAVLLSLAAVPALAETEIDQSYELHNTSVGIDRAGGYQTVRTGMTGTLDKVELLVACCGGTGMPTGDLKVTITANPPYSYSPGRPDAVAWIPKEEFTEDNELNFKWVTATLDTPLPVQTTSIRSMQIYLNDPNPSSGSYLWAVNNPGTYGQGGHVDCYTLNFGSRQQVVCEGTGWDANFRTYITPGPDTVDPDTIDLRSPHMSEPGDTLYTHNFTSFTFASDESGVTFECSMDNAAWESCTSPSGYTGLSNGSHTLQVRALDAAGNYDETPASYQFWVQYEPPDSVIDSGPSNPSNDDTPTFTFSSDPNTAFTECRLSQGGIKGWWLPCSSPHTLNSLMESGEYTFEVRAMKSTPDFYWVFDPTPAIYTWTYTALPSVTIESGPSGSVNSTTASFRFSSNENDVTFECSLDGTPFDACPSPPDDPQRANYSGLSEGPHTFAVRAKNSAGTAGTQASRTWTVDSTAPSAPVITGPAEGSYDNDGDFTISGTAEAGSTVELLYGSVSRSTQTDSSGQWTIDLIGLTEGPYSFKAGATDEAGNVSADSETRTVIVDATRPTVRRVAPAENATGVAPGANVSAVFSEATMEPTSIRTGFKLYKKGSTTALAATITYDPATDRAVLNPRDNLKRGVTYKAVIGASVQDLAGNTLFDQVPNRAGDQPKVWTFTVRT